MKTIFSILLILSLLTTFAQQKKLIWNIAPDKSIVWQVQKGQAHTDHIEMSGQQISSIVTYGVTGKGL